MIMALNKDKLNYCISAWTETFNDCACCPLYPNNCDKINGDCVKDIICWLQDKL